MGKLSLIHHAWGLIGGLAWMGASSLHAVVLRDYEPDRNDRFINFPEAPAVNPGRLFPGVDLSGVGWYGPNSNLQFALVSRRHVLFATHFANVLGTQQVRFLSSSGSVIIRRLTEQTVAQRDGEGSDLVLVTLNREIDAFEGVTPLAFLNLAQSEDYLGVELGVLGKNLRIGHGEISEVDLTPRVVDGLLSTAYMRHDYPEFFGDPSDAHLEGGDSGSPSFAVVGGKAALVGTHSYIEQGFLEIENYDAFVPHYVPQLDELMEPLGYRMRPAEIVPTELSLELGSLEELPRRGGPLDLEFEISNEGGEETGNLEVDFNFPAGQEPAAVSATGWVSYGEGTRWTLRKATMAEGESHTLQVSWLVAPSVERLSPSVTWRSDSVIDESIHPEILLAPSYADWASGLSEADQGDDPDRDRLANVLEYAIGGDPESGEMLLPGGLPLLPTLSPDGEAILFRYPERVDKGIRGLSYGVVLSTDLKTWTDVLPPGAESSVHSFTPEIPGFVERRISWPSDSDWLFVRLGVVLEE